MARAAQFSTVHREDREDREDQGCAKLDSGLGGSEQRHQPCLSKAMQSDAKRCFLLMDKHPELFRSVALIRFWKDFSKSAIFAAITWE